MARRVLGDDPFKDASPDKNDKPDPQAKRVRTPPGGVKKAAAKPRRSDPPKPPRRSKAPAADASASEGPTIPPPPPLPDFAADVVPLPPEVPSPPEVLSAVVDAVAEVVTPRASEETSPDEASVAGADAPPDASQRPVVVPSLPPPVEAAGESLEETIRTLEARLDQLIDATKRDPSDPAKPRLDRLVDRLREATTTPHAEAAAERDDGALDVTKEMFSSDFYLRQWGRVALRDRAGEVDDMGYDPDQDARWRPLFDFLYTRWWRVDVEGIENVPAEGRVALVANHSGAVPYDGVMLATALRREHPSARQLRWLAEDFIFHLPFAGAFLTRLGAVRACQENAERLLRHDACVAMFPEGVKGVSKLYRDRYRLQRFGRGGHIKLAIRTRTPIVPVAIVGAEETHPLIAPSGAVARMLGVPYFPITPTFPLLGALGAVPLPSKWRIVFGEPMPMDGYGPDAADDDVLVGRLNEKLRGTIQDMLERALRLRASVFSG